MKSQGKYILGVLAFVLILGTVPFMGIVSATVEINKYPNYSVGDYFKYDLDAEKMIETFSSQFGGNVSLNAGDAFAELRYTKTETVTVDGEPYECILGVLDMDMTFEITGESAGMEFTADVHMIMSQKSWSRISDSAEVKTESSQHIYMNMTMLGQTINQVSVSTSEQKYSPPVSEYDLPITAGKSWETQTTLEIHTITMTKNSALGDRWQKQESNTTQQTTVRYEAVSEEQVSVKAGSFETLKIKISGMSFEDSEGDMYIYVTEDGIPVKMEILSEGEPQMSMGLTEYKYGSSGSSVSSSGGLPGFEAVAAIAAISMAGLMYAYRRKN